MLKIMKIIACVLLCCVPAAGCARQKTPEREDRPLVLASFYPMYDLALKAAGDIAEVRCVVPDGTEPHDWEPAAQDIVGFSQADLFFYSGAGFETWVDTVLPAAQNNRLIAVEVSAGLDLFESGDGENDPHTWLSPKNAKSQMKAMTDALCLADAPHADAYLENYSRWANEFDKLDAEYARLRDLKRNKIIVAHAAFGYLCREYGLEQISARGFSPDAEPSPARMAEVVALAKENDIHVIFFEELASPKVAQAIAREIGAETAVLSPLEGLSAEQRDQGGDYFSVMRENLAALEKALR